MNNNSNVPANDVRRLIFLNTKDFNVSIEDDTILQQAANYDDGYLLSEIVVNFCIFVLHFLLMFFNRKI